ncbi:MAG: Phosphoribosylaminoimidazole carboxylase catalytic subunit [Candidatus Carbobacillus altaicus]|uniref:N5-carboxyaminoimidazole ribonucleotide mutase n=1 Tax=Candidatus Carbonibacillus altaicus TaxID=2163959 RepID=A0A2R6XXD1_9BACL|nr:MAG: Phosphoribosylaminoimidazole carboxylase catalytic subunit [Candidatus Carbobacillus altaicus]
MGSASDQHVTVAQRPLVGVVMGSRSDWETMKHTVALLNEFAISYEARVVSAHRTPDEMFHYAETASERGIRVIIAGAGGAAHLPGMIASKTHLPVIGVPVSSRQLNGLDSLLSIVQMPAGVPVATVAIGEAGAKNAAILAARFLALVDEHIRERLIAYQQRMHDQVLSDQDLSSLETTSQNH